MTEISCYDDYKGILDANCIKPHTFRTMLDKVVVKISTVMCKNSAIHQAKKWPKTKKKEDGKIYTWLLYVSFNLS